MLIGIDLGTTNSAVAIWKDDAPQLVPNRLGHLLTPSAVSIGEDGTVHVGLAARDRNATHPERTALSFKRYMGTAHKLQLGKKSYAAEDLSALVLESLKRDAEAATGQKVTGAVITVPAYFNETQRRATRRAGELAGLDVKRLINEPTAAALAFGIHSREDREPFLVFDLGGGTFDVSIVEIFDGIVEVRATSGDNRLGGDDFNEALVRLAAGALKSQIDLGEARSPSVSAILREAAEKCRRALTDAATANFSFVLKGQNYSTEISAAEFETAAKTLIDRLRDPVLRSLRDSNIRVDSLSEIVLVGGGTRMPVVRKAITRMFGRFPNSLVDPDQAVALGAAVQAGLLAKDGGLDEYRLTDVCPFTLGVDTTGGVFSPIIDRNTPLPASRVSYYETSMDNQRVVEFGIYQGEARNVAENVKLGMMRAKVPPKPKGQVIVECRFTYDSSGLLEVDVQVPANDHRENLVLTGDMDTMTPEAIESKRKELAKLKFHPRDDAINVAAMSRAARCYESFLGDVRDTIGHGMMAFEHALATQDARTIGLAREELIALLDAVEGEQYL
jgi:molecular chaperone HscC